MRHNRIRDLEASILKDVCKDVKVEPQLIPVGNRAIESTKYQVPHSIRAEPSTSKELSCLHMR